MNRPPEPRIEQSSRFWQPGRQKATCDFCRRWGLTHEEWGWGGGPDRFRACCGTDASQALPLRSESASASPGMTVLQVAEAGLEETSAAGSGDSGRPRGHAELVEEA